MSIADYDSLHYRKYTSKYEIAKALNVLDGLIQGVAIDREINNDEIEEIKHWLITNEKIINRNPFSEVSFYVYHALEDRILSKEERDDIHWLCCKFKDESYQDFVSQDIQVLHGILYGIIADNSINQTEIEKLQKWLQKNNHLEGLYPYDELCSLITVVLKDGVLTADEQNLLKVYFSEFVDTRTSYNLNDKELDKLKNDYNVSGICVMCPEITIEGNVFCFTGISSKYRRVEIKTIIESFGGTFVNSVSKKVNNLIVGSNGNPCWMFSCYGRKVEQAMQLRKNGHPIMVVHENDFWDTVLDMDMKI